MSNASARAPRLTAFESVYVGQLRFPWDGHEYVVQPVGARTGALLRVLLEDSQADADDVAQHEAAATALALLTEKVRREDVDGDRPIAEKVVVQRAILGAAYWQMWEDDAPESFIDRAELTALIDFGHDRVRALQAWNLGGDPKAMRLVMGAAKLILAS